MKLFLTFIILLFGVSIYADKELQSSENIWLKTYQNYKSYNITISNISKIEQKLSNKPDPKLANQLRNKLNINKSKLSLYENNKNFDSLLIKYQFEVPSINFREFLFHNSLQKLDKLIEKYIAEKNQFYLAKSFLFDKLTQVNDEEELIQGDSQENEKIKLSLKEDIEYFNDYSENIERVHQILLEKKIELKKRYEEYQDEVLVKHILTVVIIILFYITYKIISLLLSNKIHNSKKDDHSCEKYKNYNKFLALVYFAIVFIFIIFRYIDDLLYIITFLSVIAAALTIATREIILNIAGAIYIFFSSVIRVGDRVMVQFETKHTIGDVLDISLVKVKLQEIDDYTNIKEVKNVGRTIYIPNSYIFTKVFYNYSLKKNGIINDIIEFEFDSSSDFEQVEKITNTLLKGENINYKISFSLNSLKTGVIAIISYEVHYKNVAKKRGDLVIKLLKEYKQDRSIKLKASKHTKEKEEDNE